MSPELKLAAPVSPVLVGLVIAPSSWVAIPGMVGVILTGLGGVRVGLAVSVALQAMVLRQHGLTAMLSLAGLWCAWQRRRWAHLLGAALFAGAALLGTRPGLGWAGCAGALIGVGYSLWKGRGTR